MELRALGLLQKFFRAESDQKMRFECIGHNLMHYSGFGSKSRKITFTCQPNQQRIIREK
jgi:hypothetical protein